MVLNAAARLVVGTGKFSHVTPILRDVLHWLPVQHQISYKIAILARDSIHGIGPAYFGDVCVPVTAAPGRTNLRSATRGDLLIPRTWTKLGERSFRISAPTVWNSLPYSLKHSATSREHFRKELKTYLFRKAYAPASENYWRVNLLTYVMLFLANFDHPCHKVSHWSEPLCNETLISRSDLNTCYFAERVYIIASKILIDIIMYSCVIFHWYTYSSL